MDAIKKYWAHLAVYSIVLFGLGWLLHQPDEPISHVEKHLEFLHDSISIVQTVHDTIVTAPEAKGRPSPTIDLSHFVENAPKWCLPLPYFAVVPYTDSTGYDDLSIDTSGAPTIRHSKRVVSVVNTSTYVAHQHSTSDSSVTVLEASGSPFSLTAYLLTPVFQDGVLGAHFSETKAVAAFAIQGHGASRWQVVLQPELYPVRLISDVRNALNIITGVGYRF